MKKSTYHKVWPLIICFLLPIFIMAFYFAYRNMSPFGDRSILTVDLGQQYVDLFAYFRHALLNDPSGIFYSFAKAFGGEMFGTWAYYLLSPVNLLLLLIPVSQLPAGILVITLVKYGLSGLSFGYLLMRTIHPNTALMIMWSTIYALNGWIIANQLNIMWLDGMVWLPLIILGINQIFNNGHARIYILSMIMAIITNYYMAYMIFIFTIIYVGFKFFGSLSKIQQSKRIIRKLLTSDLISLGLTAWLTFPTLFSLSQGKAHYTHPDFSNHFEYFPFKMFSKLFNGSLNFDQLPNGLPNIFVGSVAIIGFIIYFFRTNVSFRKRLSCLAVTLFLLLSLCYQPLDLLWHAGQFPVWYPYRFSFIICFWVIWIAANAINEQYRINWLPSTVIAGLLGILIVYVFIHLNDFPFIVPLNFAIGTLFLLTSFILLIYTHNRSKVYSISLLILSTFEMGLNAFNSLNNLSYISNSSYTKYTRQLGKGIQWINRRSKNPFRIGKTFYRSKDDSFSNNYSGGDTFDSSLEFLTPRFMQRIGQPEGQGFVAYSNGTLLSDQLLDYQYYITTNAKQSIRPNSNRPDLHLYPVVRKFNHLQIRKDTNNLPLAFSTDNKAFHVKFTANPIVNQGRWYRAITNQSAVKFEKSHFNRIHLANLRITNDHFLTVNPMRPGILSVNLAPERNYSYYLLISPKVNENNFKVSHNNHTVLPKITYNHPVILNLASGKTTFKLLQHRLRITPFKLYRLNRTNVRPINKRANINFISNRKISGSFKATAKRHDLGTSIPATKGWRLTIDNKPRKIHKIADEFIGAKVKPGQHRFKLYFTPPLLNTGIIITFITILSIGAFVYYKKLNKKD